MAGLSDDIERLVPHLRRFARALVRGHGLQAADDIVQETVILTMRAEGLGRGPSLTCWCFTTLLRVHRQRQKQMMWERQGESQQAGSQHHGAAQRADAHAVDCDGEASFPSVGTPVTFLSKDIGRFDALPLQHREVLLLTVLAGMSYPRVAEVLSVPAETVLARLTEARDAMNRNDAGRGEPGSVPKALPRIGSRPASAPPGGLPFGGGASCKPRNASHLRVVK